MPLRHRTPAQAQAAVIRHSQDLPGEAGVGERRALRVCIVWEARGLGPAEDHAPHLGRADAGRLSPPSVEP